MEHLKKGDGNKDRKTLSPDIRQELKDKCWDLAEQYSNIAIPGPLYIHKRLNTIVGDKRTDDDAIRKQPKFEHDFNASHYRQSEQHQSKWQQIQR